MKSSTPAEPVRPIVNAKVHRTYRRVMISVFGLIILVIDWRWAVGHLYALPKEAIPAFASLTSAHFYAVAVIVVFLVTGLTFFSWTASSSIATTIAQQLSGADRKGSDKKDDD